LGGAVAAAMQPETWPVIVGALAANHAVFFGASLWPRSRLIGANIVRLPQVAAQRGEVALTFDDGPDPEVTPRVLDLLDGYKAKASFFCVGERVRAHPKIVREIVRRGNSVENHSLHHSMHFGWLGPSALHRDLEAAQALIAEITGRAPAFFRAPFGTRSPLLDPVLARCGLRLVSWTRRGFDAVDVNATRVLQRLSKGLAAGDVLLLHDGAWPSARRGAPTVLAVLPELLGRIAARGLRAVSLPAACDVAGQRNEP
jgi:peptidoglycan/xylan/chitin deacetylase (PgdA/CDA1 family)